MGPSRLGAAHSGVCRRFYDAARLRAFRGAKPLRRRAEFEARSWRGLPRRAAAAVFSRRGLAPRAPPHRRGHLAERGRRAAVLEAFELSVDLRRGEVKARGQSRGLEARRDLLHLADPPPGLARLHGDGLGALRQLGLRELPFLEQRGFDPFVLGERANRGEGRGRALGPGRVAGLERGGRARRTLQRNGLQIAAREERREPQYWQAPKREP